MRIRPFASYTVGEEAEYSKTVTDADVTLFAGLSGDINPLHLDEEYGRRTRFGTRVAHGALTASYVAASLTQLTGPGCVWVSHNLRFTAPVRIGDTVTARAEIAGLVPEKGLLRVRTTCRNQRGELLLEGEAVLRKMGELEQGS